MYGDYYVQGQHTGAYIKITKRVKNCLKSSGDRVSDSLKSSWSVSDGGLVGKGIAAKTGGMINIDKEIEYSSEN